MTFFLNANTSDVRRNMERGRATEGSSDLVANTDKVVGKSFCNDSRLRSLHWCGVLGDEDSLLRLHEHSTVTLE